MSITQFMKDFDLRYNLHSHYRYLFEIEASMFSGIFETLLDVKYLKYIPSSV